MGVHFSRIEKLLKVFYVLIGQLEKGDTTTRPLVGHVRLTPFYFLWPHGPLYLALLLNARRERERPQTEKQERGLAKKTQGLALVWQAKVHNRKERQ